MCLWADFSISLLLSYKLLIFSSISSKKISEKILCCLVYRAGTKYTVNVFGMFDGGESMPLAGEEKTTLSDEPEATLFQVSGKVI